MYRNALARRIARESRPSLLVGTDRQTTTVRRRPARTNCRRAAINASQYGLVL
jgi:hypothetical protein